MITLAPSPPVTLIAVIVLHAVGPGATTAFATATLPPPSHEIVIASLPVPFTVNTPPATFAVTAALAMPGNASAATTATPAIGIGFFHFADTGPPG